MVSRPVGDPFHPEIVACMRAGRRPTRDQLRSVAARIAYEARLRGMLPGGSRERLRHIIRAALQATGMPESSPDGWTKQ